MTTALPTVGLRYQHRNTMRVYEHLMTATMQASGEEMMVMRDELTRKVEIVPLRGWDEPMWSEATRSWIPLYRPLITMRRKK